jgi:hypothetical protein
MRINGLLSKQRINYNLLFTLAIMAAAAFGAGTGLPWEAPLQNVTKSFSGLVAPVVAIALGGLAFVDYHRHGGQVSTGGGIAIGGAVIALGAWGFPAAMALIGVTAACV